MNQKRIYPFCLQHELLNFSSLIFKMLFNGKPPYWHISNMPILQVSTRHRDAVSLDQIPAFHRSIRHIAGNHTCVKTCQGRSIFFRTSHSWLHSWLHKFPENHGRVICKQCFNKEEYAGLMTRGNKRSLFKAFESCEADVSFSLPKFNINDIKYKIWTQLSWHFHLKRSRAAGVAY